MPQSLIVVVVAMVMVVELAGSALRDVLDNAAAVGVVVAAKGVDAGGGLGPTP